jgi:hypothetical protein
MFCSPGGLGLTFQAGPMSWLTIDTHAWIAAMVTPGVA